MLKNTFLHIPGICTRLEQHLWNSGVHSWDAFMEMHTIPLPQKEISSSKGYVKQSFKHLENNNPNFFAELLVSNQHWRLFPDFRHSIAYLDIETTGLGRSGDYITTISLYDGKSIFYYINGDNLEDFKEDIKKYKVIVTYNGKCFDIPFIENYLKIRMNHTHIDLRYLLKSLGYTGGLKGCERQLGIDRNELEGVNGYFAVLLWNDYEENKNLKALETFLAYNIQDVVNLETLMVISYNLKLNDTPFPHRHQLPLPSSPQEIPFKADMETIERIKNTYTYK
ncbi:MAG: ribonuclease H-like domain-containing protein [Candidatus Scalinduaceae bacterium]